MSIVDDRGRIAGRINLVDAIVALVILGLIPVGYGAYLLFRNPTPKLFGVSPAKLYQGPNLPNALTILPLAPVSIVQMEVGGSFKELPADVASQLNKGTQFPPAGGALAEIVSVGSPR